jgi:hypothetical protein
MKNEKIYHAVHDEQGNIRAISTSTSSVGGIAMMVAPQGCSVTQVKVEDVNLNLDKEEDLTQTREMLKHYRVDTSGAGSLVKASQKQK